MIEEILKDENIRHWIWWTVIPLSFIFSCTIASIVKSKWDHTRFTDIEKEFR